MSSSWNELPNEILNIVFLYLNIENKGRIIKRNDLVGQCSLTCSQWRFPAQAVLFSKVRLNSPMDFEKISPIVLNNDRLGKNVKELHYYTAYSQYNSAGLLAIDLLFPNLEQVDFGGNESLYSTFSKIFTENGKFNNLRALPKPNNANEAGLYLKCLNYLKDRITYIELFDDNSSKSLYRNVHNELGNYPELKKLAIYTPLNSSASFYNKITRYLKTTFDSNLNSLQCVSILSMTDTSHFNMFTVGRDTLLPIKTLEAVYIDMLSETIRVPNEEFMLFIMNSFPNLKIFEWLEKLNIITYRQYSVPSEPSFMATLLLFFKFLSQIPRCICPTIHVAHTNAIKLIENLYSDSGKDNNLITPLSCTAQIILVVRHPSSQYHNIGQIAIKNSHPRLQEICYQKTYNTERLGYDYGLIEIVGRIGRFFDKMVLKEVSFDKNLVAILNSIGSDCPRLNHLVLFKSELENNSKESSLAFIKDPAKNFDVKTLTLKEFILSQEQLAYIVSQLPSLETLILENCIRKPGQYLFSICLPVLSLECLEIYLDTGLSGIFKEKTAFYIKLVTEAEREPTRYCFLTIGYRNGKLVGYTLIGNPSESVFAANVISQEDNIVYYFIYCKSVKQFTVKYVSAENGFHKQIDLFPEE